MQDWITELNEYAKDKNDRDLVEIMIMFLDSKKLGNEFLSYLKLIESESSK